MNLSADPSNNRERNLRWLLLLPLSAGWVFVPGLAPTWTLFAVSMSIFAVVKLESTLHFLATTRVRPTA